MRAQREVQHFVGEHEEKIAVVEARDEAGIDGKPARGEHAHRRQPCVHRHLRRSDESRQMRKRDRNEPQNAPDPLDDRLAHSPETFFSSASIAGSAPSAPQRSTMSVSTVS